MPFRVPEAWPGCSSGPMCPGCPRRCRSPGSPRMPGPTGAVPRRPGARRAGVLVTAPVGLCFLPAFIAVGVLPVVIGLAGGVLGEGGG